MLYSNDILEIGIVTYTTNTQPSRVVVKGHGLTIKQEVTGLSSGNATKKL